GDVTADGLVSVDDAQLALQAYTNRIAGNDMNLTDAQIKAADVNNDGELSVDDAQNILIYYVNNTVAGKVLTWEELLGKA
ncbi:MAG: glycoside hydrolase family 3, partial [Acutalibacteraceae bacterium]|nr:glycoside hydrolase family 3 [Acutalibacteraceae bacterium]